MRKLLSLLFLLVFTSLTSVLAQTPAASPAPALSGIKANLAAGEVKTLNQTDNKVTLSTADGTIDVIVTPASVFKRVPAENPVLSAAVASTFSELGIGDKVVVTGQVSADKKTIPAKQIIILSKADIAKRDAGEREMWRSRGVIGRVTAVDFKAQQITVAARGATPGAPATNVVITPKENIVYRRYAPDSGKFSDAKASSLAEIKVGDEVRALGDKSEDGATMKAEQLISGGFRTVIGNVTAVDAAKNEVTIKEISTGKSVTIAVTNNSMLKKFPAEFAARMAGGQAGGQPGGQGGNIMMRPPQQGTPTAGEGRPQGERGGQGAGRPDGMQGGGQGGRGMRGDIDSMLERMPNLTLAELKPGDAVGISGSANVSADRYTAIKLLSGIEPFIAAAQATGGNRGSRGGQTPSIEIPGLEGGFGTP